MKKYNILFIAFFLTALSFGQNTDDFEKDFKKACETDFSESDLKEMLGKYWDLLTPHNDVTQLAASIKNQRVVQYPLSEFKGTEGYKTNIQNLLNSENPNKRLLSYMIITSAGDSNHEKALLEKIKTEKTKENLIWSGMSLLYLQTDRTTPLFDFLIDNEDFGDAHMIPLYFKLNKDSLQNTAYNRINSKDIKAKILSAQLLSIMEKNEKTEKLLLDAVKNWDDNIKGYAIFSVKELQMGHLKETFIPLLDNEKTRSIAIEALANSPTKEDVHYIRKLANAQEIVSEDILNGFLKSKNPESVKYWLELVSTKEIPENYYFNIFKKPLLFSDELLGNVQTTLKTTKHVTVQRTLIKVLGDRKDSVSNEILLRYLDNTDMSVLYFTSETLQNTQSKVIIEKLIELLKNPDKRVSPITKILIHNKIDTLQGLYTGIYTSIGQETEWKGSAIEYLSNFPLEENRVIFKDIIHRNDPDFSINRFAAMGLANLNDKGSIDRIIEISEKERKGSDSNCQTYLYALSKLKSPKSKEYILTFQNSDSEYISKSAREIIASW